MPFHKCSSTFKTHGDPLFRKVSKVSSSKSHAQAHSSDSLPVRSGSFPLGSVLCVVHDWQESLGGFSSVIPFSRLCCSPSIFLQLFLSSSVLCSSLSPFSSQFTVSNMRFPLFRMIFALIQSLHLSLPFLLHFHFLPVLSLFLQQIN